MAFGLEYLRAEKSTSRHGYPQASARLAALQVGIGFNPWFHGLEMAEPRTFSGLKLGM